MPEETELLEKLSVEQAAKARMRASDSVSKSLENAYKKYMDFYDPLNGDQWPMALEDRPDKIHVNLNIVKAAVDIASRLQSILPRLSLTPNDPSDPNQRRVAEALEKAHKNWLDDSGWDVWLTDTCKVKEIYGKTVWKPIWDDVLEQPSVIALEQPGKLRIGWSGSDFRKKDWTIFEYRLSPLEAMTRWKSLKISPTKGQDAPLQVETTDHTDPLETMPSYGFTGLSAGGGLRPLADDQFEAQDFEGKTVSVWDYWYKKLDEDRKVKICNAILVDGHLVEGPTVHDEYRDIPYIVIENDHRPGSPEGISSVKAIMSLQDEFNRHFSHWAQMVADNSDPAWQLVGENATEVREGMIPKAGEVAPTGINNRIEPVQTSFNQFPLQQLVSEYWQAFHRITGLAEILFGALPGSQTSGRAVAVQIEAASNRLAPRRTRVYRGLKELFGFWSFMIQAKDFTVQAAIPDEENPDQPKVSEIRIGPLIKNAGRWDIVAPEITPRDVIEHTTNVINKLNAKLTTVRKGMDDLGEDAPEELIRELIAERNNVDLFPGDVQIKIAVLNLMQQLQMQQAAMQATAEMQGQAPGENPDGTEADGGEGTAQPMSQPGTTGGGPVSQQTLIRGQPGGQAVALQQAAIRPE